MQITTITPAASLGVGLPEVQPASPPQVSVIEVARYENVPPGDIHTVASSERVDSQAGAHGNGFRDALEMLHKLNGSSEVVGTEAIQMAAGRQNLTPGEMLQLTVHAHHFLFQSQLTANIANRTSDGIQQLFRQQS